MPVGEIPAGSEVGLPDRGCENGDKGGRTL